MVFLKFQPLFYTAGDQNKNKVNEITKKNENNEK